MRRGTVHVHLGEIGEGDSLSTLEELIHNAKVRAVAEGITGIYVDIEQVRGHYNDVSVHVTLIGNRPETDEEYNIRTGEEQENAAQREKRERAEYERLAKKFGGKS
jgi:hypothetical protein